MAHLGTATPATVLIAARTALSTAKGNPVSTFVPIKTIGHAIAAMATTHHLPTATPSKISVGIIVQPCRSISRTTEVNTLMVGCSFSLCRLPGSRLRCGLCLCITRKLSLLLRPARLSGFSCDFPSPLRADLPKACCRSFFRAEPSHGSSMGVFSLLHARILTCSYV